MAHFQATIIVDTRRPFKCCWLLVGLVESHLLFDSIRHLLLVYGNQVRVSPKASGVTLSLADQKGRYQRFSMKPTGFKRFTQGCRYRMVQEWNQDEAWSIPVLLLLLALNQKNESADVDEGGGTHFLRGNICPFS